MSLRLSQNNEKYWWHRLSSLCILNFSKQEI